MPGCELGDGVIVWAGAVVTGQHADYTIIAGNPARVVRTRFAPRDIERLKAIAWWDWPIEKILAYESAIAGGDIAALERAGA